MFGKWRVSLIVPAVLATGLSACNGSSGAVQPGVVNTSAQGASYRGEQGRVVSIREVPVRGGRSSGVSDGTLVGGGYAPLDSWFLISIGFLIVGGFAIAGIRGLRNMSLQKDRNDYPPSKDKRDDTPPRPRIV